MAPEKDGERLAFPNINLLMELQLTVILLLIELSDINITRYINCQGPLSEHEKHQMVRRLLTAKHNAINFILDLLSDTQS